MIVNTTLYFSERVEFREFLLLIDINDFKFDIHEIMEDDYMIRCLSIDFNPRYDEDLMMIALTYGGIQQLYEELAPKLLKHSHIRKVH